MKIKGIGKKVAKTASQNKQLIIQSLDLNKTIKDKYQPN